MEQYGLITVSACGYQLSEAGRKEAQQELRTHRLWESYLESIGTLHAELHPAANHLEHIRAKGIVDFLDEKLGKPHLDPNGKEILSRQNNGQS